MLSTGVFRDRDRAAARALLSREGFPMSLQPSSLLPRRRPLSASEIAAVAIAAVTVCPVPRNVPGKIDRLRPVGGTWARRRSEPIKNDAQ